MLAILAAILNLIILHCCNSVTRDLLFLVIVAAVIVVVVHAQASQNYCAPTCMMHVRVSLHDDRTCCRVTLRD